MYNIAICDDNALDRKRLCQILLNNEKCPAEVNIYEFRSGAELLNSMVSQKFSLLFLDIQMVGMDGNETAREIRKLDNNMILVFVSGYITPTTESFIVQPYRYIMKQTPIKKINEDIAAILEEMVLKTSQPTLTGKYRLRTITVNIDNIILIEKHRANSRLHISPWAQAKYKIPENTIINCNKKLDEIYLELKHYGFAYPHDSYLINLRYMISAGNQSFQLEHIDRTFHISRSKIKEFSSQKNDYLLRKYIKKPI